MTKEDREKALKCLKLSSIIGTNTLKTNKGDFILHFVYQNSF